MRRIAGIISVVAVVALVSAPAALAQGGPKWKGSGGWTKETLRFDVAKKTVEVASRAQGQR